MQKDKLPGIPEIQQLLAHRYPFLLVDRVTHIEPNKKILGIKNISYNEWYFQALPRELMIVPANVLSEAVAQLGALLILLEQENRGKFIFFYGVDRVRFRKPVRPGDVLEMTAEWLRRRGRMGQFRVEARVDGDIVLEGVMKFAFE